MSETPPPFLSEFDREDHFCAANGPIHRKTCQRYRDQPDGLPFIQWGGWIWIGPRDQARAWLLRRVKGRRPTRRRNVQAA